MEESFEDIPKVIMKKTADIKIFSHNNDQKQYLKDLIAEKYIGIIHLFLQTPQRNNQIGFLLYRSNQNHLQKER